MNSKLNKYQLALSQNNILFNRVGYVLYSPTDSFDVFIQNSIGLSLCNHYGFSKGKSLTAYINGGCESDVTKLLGDLLEFYEVHFQSEINDAGDSYWDNSRKEKQAHYKKC